MLHPARVWYRALDRSERTAFREAGPSPGAWLTELSAVIAGYEGRSRCEFPLPEIEGSEGARRVLEFARPFVDRGARRLCGALGGLAPQLARLSLSPRDAAVLFSSALPEHLFLRLTRTLALEVNVARLRGRVRGGTPPERFANFLRDLGRRDRLTRLFNEYPVLARQLVAAVDHWVAFGRDFFAHLSGDWPALRDALAAGGDAGPLVEVGGNAGESHRAGRSVLLLRFASGLRVVYKPRSLAVEVHFQELLGWLNARSDWPRFRVIRVLDRGSYGWCEFVRAAPCRSPDEVGRFYERQGANLALLYALEATDFHCENVVAAGEHPVLVDLESLFQPRVDEAIAGLPDRATDPAVDAISDSVLRVGLLPQREFGGAWNPGLDGSALGNRAGQLSPEAVPVWERFGTDEMRIVRQRARTLGAQNQPTLDGEAVDLRDHVGQVRGGFARMYALLADQADALLAGPVAAFRGDEVRVIPRATKTYNGFLRQSYHPDFLRDGVRRDEFLDGLRKEAEYRPALHPFVEAERAALRDGDVPMFTARADGRELRDAHGTPLPTHIETSGYESVRRRLRALGVRDLERQLWFLDASLACASDADARPRPIPPRGGRRAAAPVSAEELVAAAREVGDRLRTLAVGGRDGANWVGLSSVNEAVWEVEPGGIGLYGGASGIALFLAYLGAVAGEEEYARLARAAMRNAVAQVRQRRGSVYGVPPGAFTGLGGVIYTLSHVGRLWRDASLLDEADELAATLDDGDEDAEEGHEFDVMGGCAGVILSLLSLHAARPSPAALEAARRCGRHLLARARAPGGAGWVQREVSDVPLTGFSHGAAGTAASLVRLAAATGDDAYRCAALGLLAYERSVFCAERRNWPDFRRISARDDGAPAFMTAWCHGAPGVGLGRLACRAHLDDGRLDDEIASAIRTTLREGFGRDHSLCHGDLGSLELLLAAAREHGVAGFEDELARATSAVVDDVRRRGWVCGAAPGVQPPGLMAGLAGVGYGLLRLARWDAVPSVLTLAPPPA